MSTFDMLMILVSPLVPSWNGIIFVKPQPSVSSSKIYSRKVAKELLELSICFSGESGHWGFTSAYWKPAFTGNHSLLGNTFVGIPSAQEQDKLALSNPSSQGTYDLL